MLNTTLKKYSSEEAINDQADIFAELKSDNFAFEKSVLNIRHQGPERNEEGPASTPSSIEQTYYIIRNILAVVHNSIDKRSKINELTDIKKLFSSQISNILELDQNIDKEETIIYFKLLMERKNLTLGYEKVDLDAIGSIALFELMYTDFKRGTNKALELLKNKSFSRFIHIVGNLDRFGPIYKQSNRYQSLGKIAGLGITYGDLVLGLKTFIDDKSITTYEKTEFTVSIFKAFIGEDLSEEYSQKIEEYIQKGKDHYKEISDSSKITNIDENGVIKFVETTHRLSIGAELVYEDGGKIAVAYNPEDKECFIVKGTPDIESNFASLYEKLFEAEKKINSKENWILPRESIIRSPQGKGTKLSVETIKNIVRNWEQEQE